MRYAIPESEKGYSINSSLKFHDTDKDMLYLTDTCHILTVIRVPISPPSLVLKFIFIATNVNISVFN